MSNMDKQLVTTMPDGSRWAVPVSVIARHRAEAYAQHFEGDIEKSLQEDTGPLFDQEDFEIKDWGSNNMRWKDVENFATCIQPPDCDYEEGWANGEYELIN